MAEIKKVAIYPGGPSVEAEVIPIKESQEAWTTVTLDDGTQIKVKVLVHEVARTLGQYDGEGNPIYVTRSAVVQVVSSPEALRKK